MRRETGLGRSCGISPAPGRKGSPNFARFQHRQSRSFPIRSTRQLPCTARRPVRGLSLRTCWDEWWRTSQINCWEEWTFDFHHRCRPGCMCVRQQQEREHDAHCSSNNDKRFGVFRVGRARSDGWGAPSVFAAMRPRSSDVLAELSPPLTQQSYICSCSPFLNPSSTRSDCNAPT